jgi:hypothetical protein
MSPADRLAGGLNRLMVAARARDPSAIRAASAEVEACAAALTRDPSALTSGSAVRLSRQTSRISRQLPGLLSGRQAALKILFKVFDANNLENGNTNSSYKKMYL